MTSNFFLIIMLCKHNNKKHLVVIKMQAQLVESDPLYGSGLGLG